MGIGVLLLLGGCTATLTVGRQRHQAVQEEPFPNPSGRPSGARLSTVDNAQLLADWQTLRCVMGAPCALQREFIYEK